jgi:hypothetical protein
MSNSEKFAVVVTGTIPQDNTARMELQRTIETALMGLQRRGIYLNGMVLRYGELAEAVPGVDQPPVAPGANNGN